MKIQEKEIIYKLQSKGFEIYKDNVKENFLIMKHVCNCKESWFTNKKQCIFCGSLGYSIKICDNTTIGAMSFVNKDILEPGVYVGVPAKKIK